MRGQTWMPLVVITAALGLGVGGCASGHHAAQNEAGAAPARADVTSVASPQETTAAFAAPAASSPAATSPARDLRAAIRDVADAPDIDAGVDAYARGMQIDPNSVALHKAYVQRMVDLEVPQLAISAAERVLAAEPNNGLSRGVAAFGEARQGQMADALTDISLAVKRLPEDKFIARTAGHLLAWYDHNPDPPYLPANVRLALQEAHATLAQSSTFNAAFDDATAFYRQQREELARIPGREGPTTQPSTTQSAGEAEAPDYAGYAGSGIGYQAAAPYEEPYGYTSYGYGTVYDPGYSYYCAPCYGFSPFWCWGPTFVYVTECHDDHHHHGHDHDASDDHHAHHGGSGSAGGGAVAHGRGRDGELNGRFSDHFFGGGYINGGGHGVLTGAGGGRFMHGGRHGSLIGNGAINIGSEPLVPPVAGARAGASRRADGEGGIVIRGRSGGGGEAGSIARGRAISGGSGIPMPARGGGGPVIGPGPGGAAPARGGGDGGAVRSSGGGSDAGGGARWGGANIHSAAPSGGGGGARR